MTVRVDPAASGERIALDLDGSFFADVPVGADGRAKLAFAFAPKERSAASLVLRRHRGGEPLGDATLAIRFGERGIAAIDATGVSRISTLDDLGDIGSVVSGVDCAAHEVAIVVPVYDAPADVERCIESVLAHTSGRARLIVIDDASPDTAIAPLLARYAARANVRVLRNERNRGFTATANRGIAEAGRADVVLLNADTEVGPNWLTGLRRAVASGEDIATVTAVSNNAGAFSVPELEQDNAWPARWSFEQTARALWQQAGRVYPALPTGNGFCMYVRRQAVDAVGVLDEIAFPQGYGEENDFCQRASARGFRHLIAGNVYVRHARSASFGHDRRAALGEAGMSVLRERWPNYESDVAASLYSFERRVLDWRVRRVFAEAAALSPRMRVLCVGDAASTNRDLWHLRFDENGVGLMQAGSVVVSHAADRGGKDADPTPLRERLCHWLQTYAIEAVIGDGTTASPLPEIAAALGIPFANATPGQDTESALSAALSAARSFAEAAR